LFFALKDDIFNKKTIMEKEEKIKFLEYQCLQSEITQRSKILHGIISLAAILLLFSIIFFFTLKIFEVEQHFIKFYLLLLPLVFASLAFNYQANGFTLEAALKYTEKLFQKSWRPYYLEEKKRYRLIAFMKALPLWIPFLGPFFILNQIFLDTFSIVLFFINNILLLIIIRNFIRYKFDYLK